MMKKKSIAILNLLALSAFGTPKKTLENTPYLDASLSPEKRAENLLSLMTDQEKITLIGGYNAFFIAPFKRFGLREVYLTDATAGVHIRSNLDEAETESIAYPCVAELAATWNEKLAHYYGRSVGQECRQLGSDIQLGPGLNLYRTATCGRNFEYFGEDPFLVAKLVTAYIQGLQGEKVIATAKHFICNNHEWLRHTSDSIVDERTLHEIYMRPWYELIHKAQVGAVMTSYNYLNGEKVSQSATAINGLLRQDLGFDGLVMSDWGAVTDPAKAIGSGQDLIMPELHLEKKLPQKLPDTLQKKIDPMCLHILTTLFRFGIYDRPRKDPAYLDQNRRNICERIALQTAREGIVLLSNKEKILPLDPERKILLLGPDATSLRHVGNGSGWVEGYDHSQIFPELKRLLGREKIDQRDSLEIDDATLQHADTIVVCVDQKQGEGWDQEPRLKEDQEELVKRCVKLNPRTIVVVASGSGIEMDWADEAAAILWVFYPGQYGGTAIAEILTGKVNPSGKLPFTIEKSFKDSPAYGYHPEGATLFQSKYESNPIDQALPEHPKVEYKEGVFLGYRWYDQKKITPRFPFGHGLSYTTFTYSDLQVNSDENGIEVSLSLKNAGEQAGAEIVQLYIAPQNPRVPRPIRELKAFKKIELDADEQKEVRFHLDPVELAYYDIKTKQWQTDAGEYTIELAASSRDIRLKKTISWKQNQRQPLPFSEE
jgi:beta-glucosidase